MLVESRSTASLDIKSGVSERKDEMSSIIQIPRPCVASTRSDSRGWTTMSRTATEGKPLPLYCAHCLPPSMEIHKPNSVPRKSRLESIVSSVMTCAYPVTPLAALTSGVHVLPKSVVLRRYGFISPKVWRSKVAYAVPSLKRLAITVDTHEFLPRFGTLSTTLAHCLPPSRVIRRLPSSVPAQINWPFFGDSLIE